MNGVSSVICDMYTRFSTFVQSVNEIWILIKQPCFIVQKGQQNEQSLAEKLDSELLISYGIQNRYFQEERY